MCPVERDESTAYAEVTAAGAIWDETLNIVVSTLRLFEVFVYLSQPKLLPEGLKEYSY